MIFHRYRNGEYKIFCDDCKKYSKIILKDGFCSGSGIEGKIQFPKVYDQCESCDNGMHKAEYRLVNLIHQNLRDEQRWEFGNTAIDDNIWCWKCLKFSKHYYYRCNECGEYNSNVICTNCQSDNSEKVYCNPLNFIDTSKSDFSNDKAVKNDESIEQTRHDIFCCEFCGKTIYEKEPKWRNYKEKTKQTRYLLLAESRLDAMVIIPFTIFQFFMMKRSCVVFVVLNILSTIVDADVYFNKLEMNMLLEKEKRINAQTIINFILLFIAFIYYNFLK